MLKVALFDYLPFVSQGIQDKAIENSHLYQYPLINDLAYFAPKPYISVVDGFCQQARGWLADRFCIRRAYISVADGFCRQARGWLARPPQENGMYGFVLGKHTSLLRETRGGGRRRSSRFNSKSRTQPLEGWKKHVLRKVIGFKTLRGETCF